jgi:hypothetical protein
LASGAGLFEHDIFWIPTNMHIQGFNILAIGCTKMPVSPSGLIRYTENLLARGAGYGDVVNSQTHWQTTESRP